MEALIYTAARANLAQAITRVCADHEPMIITRNGQPSVVKLSLEDYNTLEETCRSPFSGTGKPEPLKHALSGYCSRRINEEHRMVYKATEDALLIAQLRYHYR